MSMLDSSNIDDMRSSSVNSVLQNSKNASEIEQSRFGLFGPDLFSHLDDDDDDATSAFLLQSIKFEYFF